MRKKFTFSIGNKSVSVKYDVVNLIDFGAYLGYAVATKIYTDVDLIRSFIGFAMSLEISITDKN